MPAGPADIWRERCRAACRAAAKLERGYEPRHLGADMRYLFDERANGDMIARRLVRHCPEMHRQFLFSLTAFGPVAGDGPTAGTDAAFIGWYQSLQAELDP